MLHVKKRDSEVCVENSLNQLQFPFEEELFSKTSLSKLDLVEEYCRLKDQNIANNRDRISELKKKIQAGQSTDYSKSQELGWNINAIYENENAYAALLEFLHNETESQSEWLILLQINTFNKAIVKQMSETAMNAVGVIKEKILNIKYSGPFEPKIIFPASWSDCKADMFKELEDLILESVNEEYVDTDLFMNDIHYFKMLIEQDLPLPLE